MFLSASNNTPFQAEWKVLGVKRIVKLIILCPGKSIGVHVFLLSLQENHHFIVHASIAQVFEQFWQTCKLISVPILKLAFASILTLIHFSLTNQAIHVAEGNHRKQKSVVP